MNKILIISCFVCALTMSFMDFPNGAVTAIVTSLFATGVVFAINRWYPEEKIFLGQVFLMALLVRLMFGIFLEVGNLRGFFAGDALTYDFFGYRLSESWHGLTAANDVLVVRAKSMPSGWGMNYLVASLYFFIGQNIFAAQSFCAVVGAATVPMIYHCATEIFNNRRVGKIASLFVAFYPAFVIWSGQLLKDGIIVFLLVLSITLVLNLQRKLDYASVILLVFAMMGIMSLRFYIFYMVAIAVVGTFVIGQSNSPQAIARRLGVLVILGLGMTYFGAVKSANTDFSSYSIDNLQNFRRDASGSADSGYGKDLDISTADGALTTLPIGFAYLMLAPFPWEMTNFRQLMTLPEVLMWWCSIPIMLIGLVYAIKHRLRSSLGVLIFTLMLTLAYSLFQGNVGTAYRVRTQIQVFLFIFIAAGWTLILERRENKRLVVKMQKERDFKRLARIGN